MKEAYEKQGVELNVARLRMATLPSPADEVLFTPGLWVPLVNLRGVYILPGWGGWVGRAKGSLSAGPLAPWKPRFSDTQPGCVKSHSVAC